MPAAEQGQSAYQPLVGDAPARTSQHGVGRFIGLTAAYLLTLTLAFTVGRYSAPEARLFASPSASVGTVAPSELWEPLLTPALRQEPIAKNTVRRFDAYLMEKAAFADPETKLANVKQWLAPDFVYSTVGFPDSKSPAGWCLSGEEQAFRTTFNMSFFSQMLFFGTDEMATTTSYGNVFWSKPLFGIPPPQRWVYFRVTDFYAARKISPTRGQLYYNFMMIDYADLLRRVGRPLLPAAALPEGLVLTSQANDGVPAPLSVVAKSQDVVTARKMAKAALQQDWAGNGPGGEAWHTNLTFYGPGGIGMARGVDQYRQHVLQPFRAAFADRRLETRIFGCEGNYCGAFGVLRGRHVAPWLGLEASGTTVALRFALHWHVVGGRALEGWAIFDVPGLFEQLGLDFFAVAAAMPVQV